MIPEIDIWRVANLMLTRYGDAARAESGCSDRELPDCVDNPQPDRHAGQVAINTASINSDSPNPHLLADATTKGAIQNFTGGLAQLLADKESESTP